MPRIRRIPPSEHHFEALKQSDVHREQADCVVRALTILTGLPYAQVHRALEEAGRKKRRGTPWYVTETAAGLLGFRLEKLPHDWMKRMIASYPGAHKNLSSITTHHPRRFRKQWADVEPLLFHVRSHVAAFKDGELHDHTVNRAQRVIDLYRLVPIGAPVLQERKPSLEELAVVEENPPYHDPELMGAYDARRGHTACPFGDKERAELWRKGYKKEK